MEKIYNKLVRDNIPDIIRDDNRTPVTRNLTDAEYEKELYRKLVEECNEVYEAEDNSETCKELADVLEVIRAIANVKGKTLEDIIKLADDKRNKRGGFSYTDMTILNTYAMQFSDNIVQEIEIINPELIICCGIGLKRIINMVYKKCNKNLNKDIIEVHHLSYVVGDDICMNEFKDELKGINRLNRK